MRHTISGHCRAHFDPEDIHEVIAAKPQTATATFLDVRLPDLTRPGWFRCHITGDGFASTAWAATPIDAFRSALRGWQESAA